MVGVWRAFGGVAFGVRTLLFLLIFHESLTPDSSLYARGRACWSSPVAAAVGSVAGWTGLAVLSFLGSVALGAVLGGRVRRLGALAALWAAPPSWYTVQAAADSAGGAAVGLGYRESSSLLREVASCAVVAGFHLVAGLACGYCCLLRRVAPVWYSRFPSLALGSGVIACLGQWHLQVRYFLPGMIVWATRRYGDKFAEGYSCVRASARSYPFGV